MRALKATIRLVKEVNDLEATWRALEERAERSFFLSWDWAATAIETGGEDLLVAEIASPDGVVAIGLLAPMTETRHGVMRVRQLRLNETGLDSKRAIPVEFNTLLALPGMESAAWDALLYALRERNAPRWDELIVTNGVSALEDMLREKGASIHRRSEYGSGYVNLDQLRASGVGDLKGYLASLGKSTRSQINRSIKLYGGREALSVDYARDAHEAFEYLNEIAMLHETKWRARGKAGLAAAAHLLEFHHKLIERTIPYGKVELARVSANGTPFAWVYNFIDRGHVLFNIGGFRAEKDKRLKPGLVAHALLIEAHLKAGRATYDFLAGNDRYKLNLGTRGPDFTGFAIQRPKAALKIEGALRSVKHILAGRKRS